MLPGQACTGRTLRICTDCGKPIESISSAAPSCAKNWESLASFKRFWQQKSDWQKKKSLELLILWHFYQTAVYESESIFWLSRKKNMNISHQTNDLTRGRLCANRFFLFYEWIRLFCPTNTIHCKCQVSPAGVRGHSWADTSGTQREGHSAGRCPQRLAFPKCQHQTPQKKNQTCFQ